MTNVLVIMFAFWMMHEGKAPQTQILGALVLVGMVILTLFDFWMTFFA